MGMWDAPRTRRFEALSHDQAAHAISPIDSCRGERMICDASPVSEDATQRGHKEDGEVALSLREM
jgi:hypothetical protein